MKYLSMQAMLQADHQKLERTEKLATLGAASRQELEEVAAIHTGHETEVAAAGHRPLLLGLSPPDISRLIHASHVVSEVTVPAPTDGVVIARTVNPGQVVGAAQELFPVTDLRTGWGIGDRSVVYVPVEGDDTRFTERPVKLGPVLGDSIQVLAGLKPGERVVTVGSFFLRAEAGRSRSGG